MTTPLQYMDPKVVSDELVTALGIADPGLLVRMDKQMMIKLANAAVVTAGGQPLSALQTGDSYLVMAQECIARASS